MSPRSRISAGILMFRRRGDKIEFLLAHPGGPLFVHKDKGHWTIPKGEAAPGEDLLTRARIEFAEEVGLVPKGPYLPLGTIKQKGGKIVHAWAVEGDLPPGFVHRSNTFELEWPLRSGQMQIFPEIDRAEFFAEKLARKKIKATQAPFFDTLIAALG
jgi:predicted NUDIX family NTP pyrophosphohydrolase